MNIPEQLGWTKLSDEEAYLIPIPEPTINKLGYARFVVPESMVLELEAIPVHRIAQILAGAEAFPKSYNWHRVVLLRSWCNEVILPYHKMRML